MEVVLHIGYPKTGSTAIQSHLFTNKRWFSARGVFVPAAGMASGAGHACLLGVEDSPIAGQDTDASFQGDIALANLTDELREAEAAGFRTAVLSWEGFALASAAAMQHLASALSGHTVTLLVYVRDQAALYESMILQATRELRYFKPAVLGERHVDDICTETNDFYRRICQWLESFGDALQVRVRWFDRQSLVNRNIVDDFLAVLGMEKDDRFAMQASNTNPSLDFFSAAFLATARQLGSPPLRQMVLSRALSRTIEQLGAGSSNFLDEAEVAAVREHFAASNRKLFAEFRPENVAPGIDNFPLASAEEDKPSPVAGRSGMIALHRNRQLPPLESWQGEILLGQSLSRVLRPPCRGWRGAENDGVWSVGAESDLAFLIPGTDSVEGPNALRLTLDGQYYSNNTHTHVVIAGHEQEWDLTNAAIEVEIDDQVRESGVKILLKHVAPEVPPDSQGLSADRGIAYKLRYLSYDFVW